MKKRYVSAALSVIGAMVVYLGLQRTATGSGRLHPGDHAVRPLDPPRNGQDLFCRALMPAASVSRTVVGDYPTVHVVVANRGVTSLVVNLLCSLYGLTEQPALAILAMDNATCPYLDSHPIFKGYREVICVPYLKRMLRQMAEFEPESIQQINNEVRDLHEASE